MKRERTGLAYRGAAHLRPLRETAIALLLAAVLCSPLLSVSQADAVTAYTISPNSQGGVDCVGLGGTWDGSSTCTLASNLNLSQGESISVNSGATLAVAGGATVTSSGSIAVNGTL